MTDHARVPGMIRGWLNETCRCIGVVTSDRGRVGSKIRIMGGNGYFVSGWNITLSVR